MERGHTCLEQQKAYNHLGKENIRLTIVKEFLVSSKFWNIT